MNLHWLRHGATNSGSPRALPIVAPNRPIHRVSVLLGTSEEFRVWRILRYTLLSLYLAPLCIRAHEMAYRPCLFRPVIHTFAQVQFLYSFVPSTEVLVVFESHGASPEGLVPQSNYIPNSVRRPFNSL